MSKRQEDFDKAANEYAEKMCAEYHGDDADKRISKYEFLNGAEYGYQYAKTHPNWISVDEDLPEKDNEFEDYSKLVVVTDGKDFYKGMYNYGGECWLTHDLWPIEDATYWMEVQLPQPPRKEEINE